MSRTLSNLPVLTDLFIDGEWYKPQHGQYFDVINPTTEQVLQQVASGDAADIDLAVASAQQAFTNWSQTNGHERAKYLDAMAQLVEERKAEFAKLETLDVGKPLAEAEWDMEAVVKCFRYYAKAARKLEDEKQWEQVDLDGAEDFEGKLCYEAVGVVGAIIPWNFPAGMALWKIAPALAAGCTVVLKPSELTPLTALQLAQVAKDVELPAGVLNIVTGTGPEAGAALAQHPDVDKVAFTGSVPTGSKVMQAVTQDIKNVSLELGGKSPMIVFDDTNLSHTVEWAMFGCFFNGGQVCSATSRLLIHEKIADHFLKRLVEETKQLSIGNPFDRENKMGPLVSQSQQEKVLAYIQGALKEGAKILVQPPTNQSRGFYVSPTVLTNVKPSMKVWREEIFGPVLSIMTFQTEEEAIQLANDTDFGLAGAVFTSDKAQMKRVTRALRCGIVWNNCSQPCFLQLPWGGMKKSGVGRELGRFGLEAYLEPKQICSYTGEQPLGWYKTLP